MTQLYKSYFPALTERHEPLHPLRGATTLANTYVVRSARTAVEKRRTVGDESTQWKLVRRRHQSQVGRQVRLWP